MGIFEPGLVWMSNLQGFLIDVRPVRCSGGGDDVGSLDTSLTAT